MRFDFADAAKSARAQLYVPDVPLQRILEGSALERKRSKVRTWLLSTAIVLAMAGTAAAITTNGFNGVRLWFSGNKTTVAIQSFGMFREPTLSDVRNIVTGVEFPVVLPVGLPAGMHVWAIQYAPADRPNFVSIDYRSERSGKRVAFAIFDPSAVDAGDPLIPPGTAHLTFNNAYYSWRVGVERVMVSNKELSSAQVEQIKSAMLASSSRSSVAAQQPMLSKAIVLGLDPSLTRIAQQYERPSLQTVVVGPENVRQIPTVVKRGRPLLDVRNVQLTNIPSVHGEPDYKNATLYWPKSVIVPPSGVRAIDAVLRYAAPANTCTCAVVFSKPSPNAFSVWMVPMNAANAVRKYSVNASTFVVKRE